MVICKRRIVAMSRSVTHRGNGSGLVTMTATGLVKSTTIRWRASGRACAISFAASAGAHKKYLDQYVAIFEWAHNVQAATIDFLRALLGVLTPDAP